MQKVDSLVVVICPAGQRAAIQAAKLGKKVVLVARRPLAGGFTVLPCSLPRNTLL